MRKAWRVGIAAMALTLVTASCGDGGTTAGTAARSSSGRPTTVLQTADQVAALPRQVVYTADLVVRVSSVSKAAPLALTETKRHAGFVFSQDADQSRHEVVLTLKVPAEGFDSLLGAVSDLGRVLRRSLKAQDVTADVVDIEGRLKTAQASADRLRSLLGDAKNAADVVAIEGELAKRETEIESLQGRLRVLNDQVALATLTVRFTERGDLAVNKDLPGFLGGLHAGWVALVDIALVLVVVASALLPFVPLVVVAIYAIRRRRRRHPRPKGPSGPSAWPPMPVPGEPPAAPSPGPSERPVDVGSS